MTSWTPTRRFRRALCSILLSLALFNSAGCDTSRAPEAPTPRDNAKQAIQEIIRNISTTPYASDPFYTEYAVPAYHRALARLNDDAPLDHPMLLVATLRRKSDERATLELAWLEDRSQLVGLRLSAEGTPDADLPVPQLSAEERARFAATLWRDAYVDVRFVKVTRPAVNSASSGEREPFVIVLPPHMMDVRMTVRPLLRDGQVSSDRPVQIYTMDLRDRQENPTENGGEADEP